MSTTHLIQGSGIEWRSKERELPLRKYIRENFPRPARGPVIEDLDLIIRHYGACNGQDALGALALVEHKSCGDWMCDCEEALIPAPRPEKPRALEHAQRSTFGLLDMLCRTSPHAERYWGFWVLTTEHRDPLKSSWLFLNSTPVDLADLADLISLGRSPKVPPLDFGIRI